MEKHEAPLPELFPIELPKAVFESTWFEGKVVLLGRDCCADSNIKFMVHELVIFSICHCYVYF